MGEGGNERKGEEETERVGAREGWMRRGAHVTSLIVMSSHMHKLTPQDAVRPTTISYDTCLKPVAYT